MKFTEVLEKLYSGEIERASRESEDGTVYVMVMGCDKELRFSLNADGILFREMVFGEDMCADWSVNVNR